jgi:hypothetical protein
MGLRPTQENEDAVGGFCGVGDLEFNGALPLSYVRGSVMEARLVFNGSGTGEMAQSFPDRP